MAASSAQVQSPSPSSPVRSRPAAAAARGSEGRSAFADALDAMERRSGEPDRDSQVTRARQTRAAAHPGHAVEASNPQTVTGQPVQEPSNAIQAVKTGADADGKGKAAPAEEAPAGDKAEKSAADPKTSDAAPVPVAVAPTAAAPQPATGKPEGEAVVEASAGTAVAAAAAEAATTPATDPAAAQAAAATAAAGGAKAGEGTVEAKAGAAAAATPATTPAAAESQAKTSGATPKTADQAQQRPIEQVNAGGEAKPRAEAADKTAKDEKPSPHRTEAAPNAVVERTEAKADAPLARAAETPSQPSATPTPAAPPSFGMEVAQKVAAQTAGDGSPVPVQALAVTIAARASQGATRFDIRLDPAELGRIDVQLTVDREGHVKSKLVVEKQETLDLLQRDQRNLERALAQAGLQTREGSLEFSLRDQGGQNGRGDQQQPDQRSSRHQVLIEDAETITALQASASTYARAAAFRGGVDIRI